MAKPNPQAGHGTFGGAEDESALAHGEASRGDAEDGEHEGDWDVPTAPDNSTVSRILGLVLVVVLVGVFSFVAYRKYDEARRNPASQTVDTTDPGAVSANLPAGAEAPPFGADEGMRGRGNFAATDHAAGSNSGAAFAQNGAGQADAFQALDEHGPNRAENGFQRSVPQNQPAPGRVSLNQTRGATNAAAVREPDGNPFGDLGNSQERRPQSPPVQSEPQQFAATGTQGSATLHPNSIGGFSPTAGQNLQGSPGNALPQAAATHTPPAAAGGDADMQNLFPDENNSRNNQLAQNPQKTAGRGTPLEPNGLTRTTDIRNQVSQIQPGQNPLAQSQGMPKTAQTPPGQSEPLDNDSLEEPHPAGHAATDNRGTIYASRDHSPSNSGTSTVGATTAGRAEAILASKERSPLGEESSFENSRTAAGVSNHPIPQTMSQPTIQPRATALSQHASSVTAVQEADARSSSVSDDPFAGSRSTSGAGFVEKSAQSLSSQSPPIQSRPADEVYAHQPGRATSAPGSVTAVGTTSDAGDYYVVQPQDNFWTISRKKYGTSRYFQALAELNKSRIPDPSRMRPGMKVSTPPAELLEERYSQYLPPGTKVQVAAAEEDAKSTPTGFFVKPDGTATYRTGEHDTLSDIAARHLGRSSRWIQIYEMNRDKLSSPNQLKVGIELTLPGDASSVGLSSEEDDRR